MERPEHPKVGDRVPVKPGSMPIMFYFKPSSIEFIAHGEWEKLMAERVGVQPASAATRGGGYTACTTGSQSGWDD